MANARSAADSGLAIWLRVGALLSSLLCAAQALAEPREHQRIEDTAYTLPAGGFSLGVWSAEVGVSSLITVGTYLPAWFAFPVVDSPIFTGFVKLRAPLPGPLSLSVRLGVAYVDASRIAAEVSDGRATRAQVFAWPLELAATLALSEHVTQSISFDYVGFRLHASERDAVAGGGAASIAEASLASLLQWRLTPTFALTFAGRLSLLQGAARIQAHLQRGATSLTAELGFRPYQGRVPWCVVPGVAFQFGRVNLEVGLGYGSYWLPIVQAPLPGRSIVPEGNVYIRF